MRDVLFRAVGERLTALAYTSGPRAGQKVLPGGVNWWNGEPTQDEGEAIRYWNPPCVWVEFGPLQVQAKGPGIAAVVGSGRLRLHVCTDQQHDSAWQADTMSGGQPVQNTPQLFHVALCNLVWGAMHARKGGTASEYFTGVSLVGLETDHNQGPYTVTVLELAFGCEMALPQVEQALRLLSGEVVAW